MSATSTTSRNFNPRAPRGARPQMADEAQKDADISIHVPREGHDSYWDASAPAGHDFNPRAPRGARQLSGRPSCRDERRFQSTCPARGTTAGQKASQTARDISIHVPREGHDLCHSPHFFIITYFNPRAPRGARRSVALNGLAGQVISIHVPREGHDVGRIKCVIHKLLFQSTCPARGTTANMHNFFVQICARVTNIPLKGMPYLQKTYVSI